MFNKPLQNSSPPFTYKYATLQLPKELLTPFPSLIKLRKDTNTCPQKLILEDFDHTISNFSSPLDLHNSLVNTDCLFSIQDISENTLKYWWFLVQINHVNTKKLTMDSLHIGDYHVNFLSRHPDDSHLCDDVARGWIEWNEYHLDDQNFSVNDAHVLFGPKRKRN